MIPIEEEMKGKVAVITGANTGIGFGCAKVFSEAGMNVVMAARRKEKGEAAAAELNAAGKGECTFFQCDVSDPDQVKALIDFAVEKYGRLDTMVNNAGYNPIHMDACDMSIESYQRVLATNLMGEFYGCKFAIPHLLQDQGVQHQYVQHPLQGGPGADRRLLLHQGRHQLHDPDHRHRGGPPRRAGERHLPPATS